MGSPNYRVPPELREAAARLMRESDLTLSAIALTTGLSLGTLCKWNRAENWRPIRKRRRDWDASPPRLAALHRLARPRRGPELQPKGVTPASTEPDAVVRSAVEHAGAEHALDEHGLDEHASDEHGLAAADLPTLRAALRAHVGRQIAAFDEALRGEGAAVIDSARVLRDLGGLKRLLDDLTIEGEGDGRTPDPSALDLAGLRAEIAGRYGRCRDERPDERLPGEPAAAAPAGAGA